MSLQLNNQNDGYYDNVFLLNTTTFLFDEVRDLIAGGAGGGEEEATSRVKTGRIQILLSESCSQIPLVSFSIIA